MRYGIPGMGQENGAFKVSTKFHENGEFFDYKVDHILQPTKIESYNII